MNSSFEELGLNSAVIEGLKKQGITVPTVIQSKVFTAFLEKKDLIIRSETGTGKTLAYLLPLFMNIDSSLRSTQVIIITPTHELAAQVNKQIALLASNSGMDIRSVLIIGKASITRQIEKLKQKPQIVVGSCGRILDLIEKRKIAAHTVKTIVIDEADRMVDDLNLNGVKAVIKKTLKERQLVMLSASISEQTEKTAKQIMKDPLLIQSSEQCSLPDTIRHYYIVGEKREKNELVRRIISAQKPQKTIVFLNQPENIEVTVEKLNYHNYKAAALYGGVRENDRRNALEDFRAGRISILVASDIGARGLDLEGLTLVINLDLPEEPSHYLHRAGRTGRNGKEGIVISIVTEFEKKWIQKYRKAFGIIIEQKEVSYGKLIDKKTEKGQNKQALSALCVSSKRPVISKRKSNIKK